MDDHASSPGGELLDEHTFGIESRCFGCAPHHPVGFHLRFTRFADRVTTRFTPGPTHEGPPGIVHGGLVTTLADELAVWTVVGLSGAFGFTGSIEARLKGPCRVGTEILGTGRVVRASRRVVEVEVTLEQSGAVRFEGRFAIALLDEKAAAALIGAPLTEAWKRLVPSREGPREVARKEDA